VLWHAPRDLVLDRINVKQTSPVELRAGPALSSQPLFWTLKTRLLRG
jgi:hypothetical protein